MSERPSGEVTRILHAAVSGDPKAANELLPLVYGELRRLARDRMDKTPPGNTLQPTALVHEAFLRLVGEGDSSWNNRGHFFAAAACAMRQILVEQARRKASLKRGGDRRRIELSDEVAAVEAPFDDLVALDDALRRLERADERKTRVVMLRFFAGLTIEEIAAALDVSVPTVEREWRFARALLYEYLREPHSSA